MYNIIPFSVIIVSFAIILFIIIRKFPTISSIDIESLPKEQQDRLREKIVIDRIKRRLKKLAVLNRIFFVDKLSGLIKKKFKTLYDKLLDLEKIYKFKPKMEHFKIKHKNNSEDILEEAKLLLADNNLEEAEKKFVEAIGLNPQNIKAYKGLGKIYLELKQYEQAKEVFEHIIKLDDKDSYAYFALGEINSNKGDIICARENFLKAVELKKHDAPMLIELAKVCQILGYNEEAQSHLKEAVNVDPNNPKYLDYLIKASIDLKDKNLAENILYKLEKINPENNKIEEYKKDIKELN
ncbi:MAG: tetratricopeptide repeat protein [Patescibacteria group bacterium]|nr:tetratricopeptide repeat protein [Patescibacteria group bacterium]